jgi:glycosyltransferase domain-containing protein
MDFVDEFYADKDLSLLQKLTLVIPTYNRNFYLSRCLWYHAHFPFGGIIVADSSPEEKKIVNRETVAKVRKMFGANIRYLEYEPETEKYGGDIYRKWGDAVQHVETRYSVISIDKAFVIPETLVKEINFLENNSDYSSATGVWYWVDKHETKQNTLVYFIASNYRKTPLMEAPADTIERYLLSIHDQVPWLLFSVFRSHTQKEVYKTSNQFNLDIRFGEQSINVLGNIFGRTKYFLNDIDHCRDVIGVNRNGIVNKSESSSTRYPFIQDYIDDEIIEQFYLPFASCIESALRNTLPVLGTEEINNLISINKKLNLSKRPRSFLSKIVTNNKNIRHIYNNIPSIIKKPILYFVYYSDPNYYLMPVPSQLCVIGDIISLTEKLYVDDAPVIDLLG